MANSELGPHTALIHLMVLVAAADSDMTDAEMRSIGNLVTHLPVFNDYDPEDLPTDASSAVELLNEEDGLDEGLKAIAETLPAKLRETAYALACDVAVADGGLSQEELRLLEMIRHTLEVGRLQAAAIELGAKARHARL